MKVKPLIQAVMGVGVAIACSSASPVASFPLTLANTPPAMAAPATQAPALVTIRREGGRCIQPGCFSEVAILTDGTYRYATHQTSPVMGQISPADLQRLQERIARMDSEPLRQDEVPMDGSVSPRCLLPVDGPETVYTFYRDGLVEQIRGCQTQIDGTDPLFQQLDALYQQGSERAIAQSTQEVDASRDRRPPRSVANTVRRAMRRDYQNRLTNIRILQSEPITWNDCLPDLPQGRFSRRPCESVSRQGWRVVVRGEFASIQQSITRTYYADRRGVAVMEAEASLTEEQRSRLATDLQAPLSQLQIVGIQEEAFWPATACPPDDEDCSIAPLGLSWRVLAAVGSRERIFHLPTLGAPLHTEEGSAFFGEGDRATLGTLPLALANAVMRDAQERLATDEIYPDPYPETGVEVEFRLGSIEPITWNECYGGTGPSRPVRGICPDITVSGWRMVVVGGLRQTPFHLVYYIPQGSDLRSWMPQPDGLQSMPEAVQRAIVANAAVQAGVSPTALRIHWVDARLWDRCLNTNGDALSCGTDIRPGWSVALLGGPAQSGPPWVQTLWTFHSNLTGSDVRLIERGNWAPPPVAPPATLP